MSDESMDVVPPPRLGDRFELGGRIGSGGMATVYLAREATPDGGARTVAIKQLHPWLAKDPEFVATLVDEGRVVSHIGHPNVVAVHDVVIQSGEIFLVLEYVHGEPLSTVWRSFAEKGERIPLAIACALVRDLLQGLHAAHEAKDEVGRPLGIVHRDVSPHNVLVGVDGRAHLLDFGLAQAAGRLHSTRNGSIKGKLTYMAPEQLRGGLVSRRSDLFAASVVLWELLSGERLFAAKSEAAILTERMTKRPAPPSSTPAPVPPELDAIAMRGLSTESSDRYATAAEMAAAIEQSTALAPTSEIATWLASLHPAGLLHRAQLLANIEGDSTVPDAGVETGKPSLWRAVTGWFRG